MLGMLLGSVNKERMLVYLAGRQRGYAREVSRFFLAPLYPAPAGNVKPGGGGRAVQSTGWKNA